jgi:imidazolonepropionase
MLAMEIGARSADHVICINEADIEKAAKSEITNVLLPAADFYLRCAYPPARKLIDAGARVALATDFNPGTSPTQNIQWVGLLARQEMKMTLPEVFVAYTLGAAYALGLQTNQGALLQGYSADFFTSQLSWNDFFYSLQPLQIDKVWIDGLGSD